MKDKIKGLVLHPLFSGSMVMIVGQNLTNAGQYLYHLAMGRLLGPHSYGDLAAIISLSGLLGMVPFSLGLVVVKFVSSREKKNEISNLVTWVERKSLIFGFFVAAVVVLLSPFISGFLQIDNKWIVSLVGPMFLLGIVTYFNRASLQGLMRFGRYVSTLFGEVVIKLGVGILLVILGYSVLGALAGAVVGGLVSLALSHFFLRDYLVKSTKKPTLKPLLKYAFPVLIMTISVTSLYSTDLVLAKHFFGSFEAGIYASLSTLGKIVYFGAAPVSAVMFPMISKRHSRGEGYRKIFLYSFVLASGIISAVLFVYYFFPQLAITILFGSSYLEASPHLFRFGLFIALLAISFLYLNFYVSLGRTRIVALSLVAALIQASGIWMFHDSISMVINVSLVSVSFLFVSLLIYFAYEQIQKKG